jgi:phosphoribosylanthranilate isomerase
MNEVILTTPDQLRQIINECLAAIKPEPLQTLNQEQPKYAHSLRELADFLGCSIVTAFKLKESGKIRFQQFGRKLIFNCSEVLEDLKKTGGLRHSKDSKKK